MERIGVIGTSYRTTSIDTLAAAALPTQFGPAEMRELAELAGYTELVYVSTCNRVEYYFRAEERNNNQSLLFHLRHTLADLTDGAVQLPADEGLYVHRGEDAARHLFRVTAALDSMMVGEAQIAGQVKEAHERAHEMELLGGILDQTFHEAFHLAKRVRSETDLARRPVSLVTLVERRLHDHLVGTSAPVLVLGAGEMAEQTLRLVRAGDRDRRVLVANRTPERGARLVEGDPAAQSLPLERVLAEPPPAGIVVAATAAAEPLLGPEQVARMRDRLPEDEPLLVIDLALPANVAPEVGELERVTLIGIEQMRAEAETNRQARLAEMDRCEALVDHQLLILRRRVLDRALSPVARSLNQCFSDVSARAVAHAMGKKLAHLPESDRMAVEKMAADVVKRLVQLPLRGLKEAAWEHSTEMLESFVKGLEGPDRPRGGEES